MKAPLRLLVLTVTTIFLVGALVSHDFISHYGSSSRLLLQSRGYLPSTLLSWGRSGANDSSKVVKAAIQKEQERVLGNAAADSKSGKQGKGVGTIEEIDTIHDKWPPPKKGQGDKIVVMGKMESDYTDWVERELPDWQRAIYHVDALNHTTPATLSTYEYNLSDGHFLTHQNLNKAREALPYLTYLINNYDSPYLPSTIVFVHAHRDGFPRAWHTDAPGHSQVTALKALKLDYIQTLGYTNLRCNGDPGCPAEVRPLTPDPNKEPEAHMAAAWPFLFPERATDIPAIIAAPCCAQFAVSKTQVRARPLSDYIRIRDWLVETDLSDYVSGRIMEYSWHILFGQKDVSCPDIKTCYCNLYGRRCQRGRGAVERINQGPPPDVQGVRDFSPKGEEVPTSSSSTSPLAVAIPPPTSSPKAAAATSLETTGKSIPNTNLHPHPKMSHDLQPISPPPPPPPSSGFSADAYDYDTDADSYLDKSDTHSPSSTDATRELQRQETEARKAAAARAFGLADAAGKIRKEAERARDAALRREGGTEEFGNGEDDDDYYRTASGDAQAAALKLAAARTEEMADVRESLEG